MKSQAEVMSLNPSFSCLILQQCHCFESRQSQEQYKMVILLVFPAGIVFSNVGIKRDS